MRRTTILESSFEYSLDKLNRMHLQSYNKYFTNTNTIFQILPHKNNNPYKKEDPLKLAISHPVIKAPRGQSLTRKVDDGQPSVSTIVKSPC